MIRIVRSFLFIILLIITPSLPAYAVDEQIPTDDCSNYVEIHGGDAEQQRKNQEILSRKPNFEGVSMYGWGYGCIGDFPIYQQETSYYCGPACLQMVIEYLTGTKYSQSTLATKAGTASSGGTYVYRMANTLNDLQSENEYGYKQFTRSTTTASTLEGCLTGAHSSSYPVIYHAMTGSLELYNGTNLGHYVVGVAISCNGGMHVAYVDPYYRDYGRGSVFGLHTDTLSAFYDSLTKYASRYLIF